MCLSFLYPLLPVTKNALFQKEKVYVSSHNTEQFDRARHPEPAEGHDDLED